MIRRSAEIFACILIGSALAVAGSAGDGERLDRGQCSTDRDCSGYRRCLDRVCAVPPAVLGRSHADTPVVELVGGGASRGRFFIELANDAFERGRGLSHRPSLAEGWGMLFAFPGAVRDPFTMALMHFPLDMIFLDESGRIVDIIDDATPPESRLVSSKDFQFVVELNAGAVRGHGIAIGDQMHLTGLRPPLLPISQ